MDDFATLDTPGGPGGVKVVEWTQNQLIRSLCIWAAIQIQQNWKLELPLNSLAWNGNEREIKTEKVRMKPPHIQVYLVFFWWISCIFLQCCPHYTRAAVVFDGLLCIFLVRMSDALGTSLWPLCTVLQLSGPLGGMQSTANWWPPSDRTHSKWSRTNIPTSQHSYQCSEQFSIGHPVMWYWLLSFK